MSTSKENPETWKGVNTILMIVKWNLGPNKKLENQRSLECKNFKKLNNRI